MSDIVKCSCCREIFSSKEFDGHECHIPWKDTKDIPVLYYIILDKIKEKKVLGVGLDGTHYFFIVKRPQAVPFIRGIFPSDESKRHKDSDGEVTEPLVSTMDSSSGPREIMIDDAGWGDLILGVVIGALELPARRYMERRIPVAYFQSPRFEGKEYLTKTVDIIQEIIQVMRADETTRFKVCSGYILSAARRFLEERGYHVEKIEVTGELQQRVEHGFMRWCMEVGVPPAVLSPESGKNRFWALLEWVAENPPLRERLVKTGWKSWQRRWRKMVYEREREIRGRTLE